MRSRSDFPNEDHPEPPKKKHRFPWLPILLVLVGLFFLYLCYHIFIIAQWDREKTHLPVADRDRGNVLRNPESDLFFLLAGVDDTGAGTPQRTDTLMLFRVQFKEKRITAISIPRDTRCFVNGSKRKINSAYATGGITNTISSIRRFLGVDLDYYVILDFETVKALVNANGGVRYHVPEEAVPDPVEEYRTGDHVLDGKEAVFFLRHRHGYANGDLGRVEAQQKFFEEMLRQMLAPTNVVHFPALLRAFIAHGKTNIPFLPLLPQVVDLIGFSKENLSFATLPGKGKYLNGISYYVAEPQKTLRLVEELFPPFLQQ